MVINMFAFSLLKLNIVGTTMAMKFHIYKKIVKILSLAYSSLGCERNWST